MLYIHRNARTTPTTRAEIARFAEPSGTVAQRYGINAENRAQVTQARHGRLPRPLRSPTSAALEGH